VGSLKVGRRWRRHAGTLAGGLCWLLRFRTTRGGLLLLLLWRGTILLKQLLRRVVLCSFLEALDGSVALLVQLFDVGFGVGDAVVKVARERIADAVDTAQSAGEVVYLRGMHSQQRAASHSSALDGAPVPPARHHSEQ
jgi:hypothetical protein